MEITAEAMIHLPEGELLETYRKSLRLYAEKKFARDTERGRIAWQGARFFVTCKGGVTERQMALEASEDFAKRNQQVREMTLDLDLLKADVDVLALAFRVRGTAPFEKTEQ
ncbi:hypothetical protein [Rhizomicrobium electricum]|jgi:hypothetical protein|uniref:Uncharacterized protein n=1 Tax=Rhizomicrobium electricum TaxID=480070 RepID=A0ABN1F433_9PROT|nr:hypothetical protein [Rhizomicrobium electricum]NIJ49367.1 hypothetical protein [Rhizomicrobium electricum]